ncbi:hypothetical protein SLOPH_592 [Spraguea lophii 42_110]|uniref:Uncharacterized protein n=1 Tax=Spraguea lophii (strain 42_110) TaxID=1358809 RepID=S7WA31_SPRLO|nr:hypothetical protein SLOPH_592 [Spraguea lophii 42_110]
MNRIINNVMLIIIYFGSNYAAERQNRNNDKIHQKIQNQDSCKSSNILRNILTQSYNTGLSVNTHFNANYQKTLSMGLEENEFSENMQQQIEDQTNISQRIDDDPMLDYGFMMDAPFPDDPTRDIEEVLVPSTASVSSIKSSPYHLAYISPRTDPLATENSLSSFSEQYDSRYQSPLHSISPSAIPSPHHPPCFASSHDVLAIKQYNKFFRSNLDSKTITTVEEDIDKLSDIFHNSDISERSSTPLPPDNRRSRPNETTEASLTEIYKGNKNPKTTAKSNKVRGSPFKRVVTEKRQTWWPSSKNKQTKELVKKIHAIGMKAGIPPCITIKESLDSVKKQKLTAIIPDIIGPSHENMNYPNISVEPDLYSSDSTDSNAGYERLFPEIIPQRHENFPNEELLDKFENFIKEKQLEDVTTVENTLNQPQSLITSLQNIPALIPSPAIVLNSDILPGNQMPHSSRDTNYFYQDVRSPMLSPTYPDALTENYQLPESLSDEIFKHNLENIKKEESLKSPSSISSYPSDFEDLVKEEHIEECDTGALDHIFPFSPSSSLFHSQDIYTRQMPELIQLTKDKVKNENKVIIKPMPSLIPLCDCPEENINLCSDPKQFQQEYESSLYQQNIPVLSNPRLTCRENKIKYSHRSSTSMVTIPIQNLEKENTEKQTKKKDKK